MYLVRMMSIFYLVRQFFGGNTPINPNAPALRSKYSKGDTVDMYIFLHDKPQINLGEVQPAWVKYNITLGSKDTTEVKSITYTPTEVSGDTYRELSLDSGTHWQFSNVALRIFRDFNYRILSTSLVYITCPWLVRELRAAAPSIIYCSRSSQTQLPCEFYY